jgi:hypothetical protein
MFSVRVSSIFLLTAALVATTVACGPTAARADHKCDPVTDAGWNVVPAEEAIGQVDSAPFQEGASGNWFIDRATTVLPFCHYYNAIGIYSMRSYSLAPRETKERVAICLGTAPGSSAAVPPYAGPCPPM